MVLVVSRLEVRFILSRPFSELKNWLFTECPCQIFPRRVLVKLHPRNIGHLHKICPVLKNIQKFLQIRLLYFSFTIPHKVVLKDFTCLLVTTNLRNNSLLLRTTSIACRSLCQKLFVPNLILIVVVLGRS